MQKIILTKSIPAAGKSTWAKSQIAKDPLNWIRINNDDIRLMANNAEYSPDYEKLITNTRNFLIREALKSGKNVILDNLNLNKIHFENACSIVKSLNIDCEVIEKHFYIELEEAVLRDSKREGKARVGEEIIKKWYKSSGGKAFKNYKEKHEVFYKTSYNSSRDIVPLSQNESLPKCAIFDNDGTISLLNGRNPYDASTCDKDSPHKHVIECMKLYFNSGYKIIFVSGREEKDREPTEKFYKLHFPEVKYELFMRPTGDQRKDVIIKEEIFNSQIKDKYYVSAWFDDRLQIVKWLYNTGFPVFRVNDPEASF